MIEVIRCKLWPKDAKEFKKRFQELPYEACCLMSELCDKKALGIDFQQGILYLEKSDDLPILKELTISRVISPLPREERYGTELRGKECFRYLINPYMFQIKTNFELAD